MFAGAAFTDEADIEATEAVNMLTALGVIDGYTDGTFRPDGTVTRAEMAKMIFVVWNGGKSDAAAYKSMNSAFADTQNHWASGYINFCASNGIIAGKSATVFDPDATVTGQEAAKMLLTVIGYDQKKAGLTGANWRQNTMSYAGLCGLFDDVDSPVEQALPRQYAAQMIYNALDCNRVKWSTDSNSFDDITSWNGSTFVKETVGEKYMDLRYATGTLLASGKVGLKNEGASETLVVEADEDQVVYDKSFDEGDTITFTDVTTDFTAYLGMNVKVMYKDKDEVYGVYATDDNKVNIAAVGSDLDSVSGETKFKVDGTKYSVNTTDGMDVYTISVDDNGDAQIVKTYDALKSAADIKAAIDVLDDDDMAVNVISNDNDTKVDMIIVYRETFAKLTTINSTSVSYKKVLLDMKGNTTGSAVKLDLEDDEPSIYDGYKKDDYVFVGADLYNDAVVITKADTISGTSEAFKADSIKLDGTWHDFVLAKDAKYTAKSGKTYTAYVYGNHVYYLTGESGSGSDVDTLLVKSVGDYQKMDSGVETKVYFEDGKQEIINVKTVVVPDAGFDQEDYDKDNTAAENKAYVYSKTGKTVDGTKYYDSLADNIAKVLTKDTLYAYEKDGSDYTLFALDEDYASNDVTVTNTADDVDYNDKTETFSGVEADDAAPIFLKYSDDSYKVITGSALKGYKSMTGVADSNSVTLADDDNIVAAFIDLGSTGLSSSDTLYGVVKKAYKGTESDGSDTVVYLDLVTSEGIKTVETEETSYGGLVKGAIISFTGSYEKANDDIEIVSDVYGGAANGTAKSQGFIAISNDWSDSSKLVRSYQNLYFNGVEETAVGAGKVVSDSVVINIDEDDYVVDDASPAKAEELEDGTGYYANAYVIVNSDNEIELLVYETNNRIEYVDAKGNRADAKLTFKSNAAVADEAAVAAAAKTVAALTAADATDGATSVELAADLGDVTVDSITVAESGYTASYDSSAKKITVSGTFSEGTTTLTLTVKMSKGTVKEQTATATVTVTVAAAADGE